MDTTQWAQGLGFMKNQMGEDQLLVPSSITTNSTATRTSSVPPISQQLVAAERKAARPPPQKEQPAPLHCPRCKSSNTKFCYYNNYSLTQPRYICKACRRYWTEGGSLRNVPVGGGSRKNKRHSSASTASASSNIKNHQIPSSLPPSSFPTTSQAFNQVHDLNLAYPNYNHNFVSIENGSLSGISHMELLRSTTRGLGPVMPMHMPMTSMAPGQESSGAGVLHAAGLFPFDGSTVGSGGMQEGGRRLMFNPFGSDMKQEQHRGHGGDQQPMFWNGMMSGGGDHAGAGSW